MIQLNNGRTMKLEIYENNGEQFLKVTIFDEEGNVDSRRTINPEEIVLLIDYYTMKKDNGEELL